MTVSEDPELERPPGPHRQRSESEAALIQRAGLDNGAVLRIDDRETILDLLSTVAAQTRHEVCTALPGGPYDPGYLRGSWDKDIGALRRGVDIRGLYQADAARSPEVLRFMTEFVAQGAKVRVAARVRHRMIIVDRELVLVSVHEDSLSVPFLVVREPAMVRSFESQFASMWRHANSVGTGPEDSLHSELVRETLQILASGATDEAAARQLGVSVRTVRRRVAAVMELLGAASRFEAGVKAVEAGWL